MDTRIDGRLKVWNEDKGYGFIEPLNGGQDVFVHVSNYPRRGGKPVVGEALSFAVALNKDGKKNAINVQRPHSNKKRNALPRQQRVSFWGVLASIALIGLLLFLVYQGLRPKLRSYFPEALEAGVPGPYSCDGRRYCSQMTSCAEATYFLRHCPGTEMDGDGDGVPCESQWCTSPWAK